MIWIKSHFDWALFFLVFLIGLQGQVSAQTQTPQQTSNSASIQQDPQYQAKMEAIEEQREALMDQERALEAKGATPTQLIAWHQQNAAQLAALCQQARDLAASLPLPTVQPPTAPLNASAEMQEFLQNRATLVNSFAQLHNQALATGTAASTSGSASQTSTVPPSVDDAVTQQWQQQNAALLARQKQLAPVIANQEAQKTVLAPPPLVLPPNASSQLQAYLTARDQLMRDEIQLSNQYRLSDPSVRNAALQQWQQVNASRFAQLKQLAQALSQTTQTQGGASE